MTQKDIILKISNLFKSYEKGKNIFEDFNVEVKKGNIVAIVGPSGSGKSTLLHMIAGLDRHVKGEILFNGYDISKMSDGKIAKMRKNNIGVIYQYHHLLQDFNVMENILIPQMINGVDTKLAIDNSDYLLSMVDLSDKKKSPVSHLSGGEKQRVAIARGFANMPQMVLADEPTGNLDSHLTMKIFQMIKKIANAKLTTVIIATHDDKIASMADKLIEINR